MKKVYVQPYWPFVIFGLCGLVVATLLYINTIDRSAVIGRFSTTFILTTGLMLKGAVSFVLTPRGIWVVWLFIPTRLIRWDDVSYAMYLYHWTVWQSYNKAKGQGIIITLHSILPFNPTFDAVNKFTMKHPIGSVFIRLTKRNRDRVVKAFREYFPKLTFQEGSELNMDDL